MATYVHDPAAVLDYAVDWSAWLGDDSLVDATWSAPDGVTVLDDPAPAVVGKVATVWLSGGTPGQKYVVTCHVVSAAGRQDDRSFSLIVQDR